MFKSERVGMLHRSLGIIFSIIAIFVFFNALCTLPVDPSTLDENVVITLTADSTTCLIGNTINLKVKTSLIQLVDSIKISFGDGTDSVIVKATIDTCINFHHVFTTDGEKKIITNAITAKLVKSDTLKVAVIKPVQFLNSGAVTISGSPSKGTPLTLTVSAEGTYPLYYKWFKNGSVLSGSDNATFVIQSISDSDTGTYFCVVRNSHGVDTSVFYNLQYAQIPPVIKNGKVAQFTGKMESDSAFSLFIAVSGSDELIYQWYKNGQKLVSENNDTLQFPSLRAADTGTYTCIVKNSFGADTCKPFKIALQSLINKPEFVGNGRVFFSGTQKIDSTLKIYIQINGDSREIQRQWYKDNVILSDEKSDSLVIPKLSSENNGKYFCVISNSTGADTSLIYTVLVGSDTKPFIQNSQMVLSAGSMFKGSSLVLFIQALGSPEIKYQWYKNNALIAGKVKDTLSFGQLTEPDSGSYFCIAQNSFGADTSKAFVVNIKNQISPPEIADSGAIKTDGIMALDEIFAMYITPKNKLEPVDIQWYRNGKSIPGQTEDMLAISKLTFADTGSYYCIVKNEIGADTSKTFYVTIAKKSEYTVTLDGNIAGGIISLLPVKNTYTDGDTVSVQARSDIGYSFTSWSKDLSGSTNPMIVIVKKNMTIGALFTPNGIIENTPATAGSSLNALIKQVSAAPVPGIIITPDKGNYENNTITIDGKVTIPIQRR